MRFLFLFLFVLSEVNAMKPEELNYEMVASYGEAPTILVQISEDVSKRAFTEGAEKLKTINDVLSLLNLKAEDLYFNGDTINGLKAVFQKTYEDVNGLYQAKNSPYDQGYNVAQYVKEVVLGILWNHWNYLMSNFREDTKVGILQKICVSINVLDCINNQFAFQKHQQ